MNYFEKFVDSKGFVYSVDNVVFDFVNPCLDFQHINKDIEKIIRSNGIPYRYWRSSKFGGYLHNYIVNVSDDMVDNDSVFLGLGMNLPRTDDMRKCRIDYNPNRVLRNKLSKQLFVKLFFCVDINNVELKRYDIAIDMPFQRNIVHLLKDGRMYEEIRKSYANRTQYLGQRNKAGRVKLYNKSLEQKLDIDLTRLELSVAGDATLIEILEIIPEIYCFDHFPDEPLATETDRFIFESLCLDPSRISTLSRRKREKFQSIFDAIELKLSFDSVCIDECRNLAKKLFSREVFLMSP